MQIDLKNGLILYFLRLKITRTIIGLTSFDNLFKLLEKLHFNPLIYDPFYTYPHKWWECTLYPPKLYILLHLPLLYYENAHSLGGQVLPGK